MKGSLKKQTVLACIPIFGLLIVLLCGFFALKKKGKGMPSLAKYFLLTVLPVLLITALGVVIFAPSATADNATKTAVFILVFMCVGAWISAFLGVWLQKRMLQRVEKEEFQNFIG